MFNILTKKIRGFKLRLLDKTKPISKNTFVKVEFSDHLEEDCLPKTEFLEQDPPTFDVYIDRRAGQRRERPRLDNNDRRGS
jgi:hypothetical protein